MGNDLEAFPPVQVQSLAIEEIRGCVSVTVVDDSILEPDEYLTFSIIRYDTLTLTDVIIGSPDIHTVVIQDNDSKKLNVGLCNLFSY